MSAIRLSGLVGGMHGVFVNKAVFFSDISEALIIALLEEYAHTPVGRIYLAIIGKSLRTAAETAMLDPFTAEAARIQLFHLTYGAAALVYERPLAQQSVDIVGETLPHSSPSAFVKPLTALQSKILPSLSI